MTQRKWREATADLILKVPPIWFTNAGIRLACTIVMAPIIAYLLYPSVAEALRQVTGSLH